MKNIGFILAILFFAAVGCENNENSDEIITPDYSHIKEKLIGEWIEFSPCDSCQTLIISNDTIKEIYNLRSNNNILYYSYDIISEDSLIVTRHWQIDKDYKTTKSQLVFHGNDTLELKQFIAVTYGISNFDDIKLYKNK